MKSLADAELSDQRAQHAGGSSKSFRFLAPRCDIEVRSDGVCVLRNPEPLKSYPEFLTDRLELWAETAPDRIAFAQRDQAGDWRRITYCKLFEAVEAVGAALVARGLSAHRPVAILSENDIEQAVLVLACQYVGVPVAPVSPAYSLISQDFERLRHVMEIVRPGLIFANQTLRFRAALDAVAPVGAEIVCASPAGSMPGATKFAELLACSPGAAMHAARDRRTADDSAKILFTSGSTGVPKGVINTHRMITANQQMLLQVFPFLESEPPQMLDWLPWHHTFGGNHNFGMAIYNGGSFTIDDGKPTPHGIARTVRNLMEVSPTVYFNVPRGYADLVRHLDADPNLADRFFGKLNFMFYSGASLDRKLWDALIASSLRTTGRTIPILTSLGSTETGPASITATHLAGGPGEIGLPMPGVEAKLVPSGEKLELRLRGPHVMPGYLGQPELNATCFDDEGFYKIGDAVRFVDPADPDRGLAFDGRIAEDFKLQTGTWVNVATIKARLMAAFAPRIRDVVVLGADREELAALLIGVPGQVDLVGFQAILDAIPAKGSSERVARVAVLSEDLSIDKGEITDKGSINPRSIIAGRTDLIEALYRATVSAGAVFVRTTP